MELYAVHVIEMKYFEYLNAIFYVLQRECKMEGRPIISYAGDRKIFQRLESGAITEIIIYA